MAEKTIIRLIGDGKTLEAIKDLEKKLKYSNEYDNLLILKGRLTRVESAHNKGILTFQEREKYTVLATQEVLNIISRVRLDRKTERWKSLFSWLII